MSMFFRALIAPILLGAQATVALAHGVGPEGNTASPPSPTQQGPVDPSRVVAIPQDSGQRSLGVLRRAALWRPGTTIKVCFLEGSQGLRRDIAAVAQEWLEGVNLNLDFGSSDLRTCGAGDGSVVRIGFSDPTANYSYSYVGTDSAAVATSGGQTMNLYKFATSRPSPQEFRRIVLHEWGHALGLEHEQQNPIQNFCVTNFDRAQLLAHFARIGWGEQEVDSQITSMFSVKTVIATGFTPQSIMYYAFVKEVFKPGTDPKCWSYNTQLSDDDRRIVRDAYPFGQVRLRRQRLLGLTDADVAAARATANDASLSRQVDELLRD